jgi:hypothetical protein
VDDQTFDWSGLTVEFNTKFGTKDTAIGILTWHWIRKLVKRFKLKESTWKELRLERPAGEGWLR